MSTLETVLVIALVALLFLVLGAVLSWWLIGRRGRVLAKRVGALPNRQKAQLAGSLFRDPRLPLLNRLVLMGLVIYVAMPIDLIPDFIPVLGQIDDVVMLSLGAAILIRSVPQAVFDEHLRRLEGEVRQGTSADER
jgi:uncharacterized membrane protein YkvA (DUF1232 family)